MLGKTTTTLLILSLGGCHPAFAEAPCEYDKTVETNWTQHIEKTSNIDKKVFRMLRIPENVLCLWT